jgi:hypothetical protein
MIEHITYGTFIFFGLMTFFGVLHIWFVVSETKRLSLEEMDVVFGTQGLAEAVSRPCVEGAIGIGYYTSICNLLIIPTQQHPQRAIINHPPHHGIVLRKI